MGKTTKNGQNPLVQWEKPLKMDKIRLYNGKNKKKMDKIPKFKKCIANVKGPHSKSLSLGP
jgi:hypothetical protein